MLFLWRGVGNYFSFIFSVVIILNYFGPKFLFVLLYKFVDINYIMFLFLDWDTGLEMDNICILVLFGKCHIHKAKCMLTVPNGRLFSIDLNIFYESLTSIQYNRKAVKPSQLLKRILYVRVRTELGSP